MSGIPPVEGSTFYSEFNPEPGDVPATSMLPAEPSSLTGEGSPPDRAMSALAALVVKAAQELNP